MKLFQQNEMKQAIAHSVEGGQALHIHKIIANRSKAPSCFIRAVNRGEFIAHLFDQDEDRLRKTVKSLGVNVILVERKGTPKQHIDLCGVPLKKAMSQCDDITPSASQS